MNTGADVLMRRTDFIANVFLDIPTPTVRQVCMKSKISVKRQVDDIVGNS